VVARSLARVDAGRLPRSPHSTGGAPVPRSAARALTEPACCSGEVVDPSQCVVAMLSERGICELWREVTGLMSTRSWQSDCTWAFTAGARFIAERLDV
jgi:hypothetical protein